MTYNEALVEVSNILTVLEDIAAESWIVEGFISEALVLGNPTSGYTVDLGTLLYTLREMGEHQLALDLERQLTD